jgi:hypothetical protein
MIEQYADNKDNLSRVEWKDTMVATLRCGVGGGYFIIVGMNKTDGKVNIVSVVPGE